MTKINMVMKVNKYILDEICKGMDMGVQAVDAVYDHVTNLEMKHLLNNQKSDYLSSKNKAIQLAKNIPEQTTQTKMESAMAKMMIYMKTMMNDSDEKIAQMMIQGSNMLLIELNKLKNEYHPQEEVLKFMDELLKQEQKHMDELKPFFYQKLNELEQKIKLQEDTTVSDISQEILSSITKCRARLATVMTEFENFFYRDDVVYEDFSLQELATTCIGIERQIHADFDNINLKTNINGTKKIVGSTFSDFVEIIILLMNNALTHAGFDNMNMLDLVLNFSLGGETDEALAVQETLSKSKFKTTDLS